MELGKKSNKKEEKNIKIKSKKVRSNEWKKNG